MDIDNSKVVLRDRILLYIMAICFVSFISVIFVSDTFESPVFGIRREFYAIGIAIIYVSINAFRFIIDLNFFSFSQQGEKIIIRYYSLRPFMQKRKSIEIPKNNLIKFEIKKSFFGQKKQLVLFQRVNNKIAKYPPISISALNKAEYAGLLSNLNVLTKTN